MKTKKCITCNKRRLLDKFLKSKTSKDGYRRDCNSCLIERYKAKDLKAGKKACRRCNKSRLLEDYAPHRGTKDGLNTVCKKCVKKAKGYVQLSDEEMYELNWND